jgi:hypothetical protein
MNEPTTTTRKTGFLHRKTEVTITGTSANGTQYEVKVTRANAAQAQTEAEGVANRAKEF